jgi:hypothetical protein
MEMHVNAPAAAESVVVDLAGCTPAAHWFASGGVHCICKQGCGLEGTAGFDHKCVYSQQSTFLLVDFPLEQVFRWCLATIPNVGNLHQTAPNH